VCSSDLKLNNSDFSTNEIVKFKRIDGAGNVFLSLLVPGLGDTRVNGGKGGLLGSPIYTSIAVYGSILYGVSVKIASNEEYEKYLDATTQIEMEQSYERANSLHKQALIFTGIGSIIWISDIIWVAVKGSQNSKNNKSYRNQFSINYDGNSDTFLIGYSFNF